MSIDTDSKVSTANVQSISTLDHEAAERAFAATASLREELVGATLPRLDLQQAAAIASSVVAQLDAPEHAARMALLPEALLPKATRELLKPATQALWAASLRRTVAEQIESDARLPAELLLEANDTKARMMRVVEYVLGEHPEAGPEIAGIRAGMGHFDLAMGLSRLARLYKLYPSELEADGGTRYRPEDMEIANRVSADMLKRLGSADASDAEHARQSAAKAFRLLESTYNEIRPWALAMFVDAEKWFPSLYGLRERRRGGSRQDGPDNGDAPTAPGDIAAPLGSPAVVAQTETRSG